MRKLVVFILFIGVLALSSCCKDCFCDDCSGGLKSVVYAVGNNGDKATIWISGRATELTSNGNKSVANSLFVSPSGVEYVAGAMEVQGKNSSAVYWHSGQLTELTNGDNVATARSIFVAQNNVYIVGHEQDAVTKNHIVKLWNAEGKAIDVTTDADNAQATSMFVSGSNNVYISGSIHYAATNKRVAKLWKLTAGVVETIELTNSANSSIANSVFISDGKIYCAGVEDDKATLWQLGGETTELKGATAGSQATSIFVLGTDVYVAGVKDGGAVYWKNGELNLLSNTSAAYSVWVLGTNIYVAGKKTNSSNSSATYWKSGIQYNLTEGNAVAQINSIFVK